MLYKMNMFFREWEGYEKLYNSLKENPIHIQCVKLAFYLIALVLVFFNLNLVSALIRVILYIPLTIAEFFTYSIMREKQENFSALLSYILMFLNVFVVVMYSILTISFL